MPVSRQAMRQDAERQLDQRRLHAEAGEERAGYLLPGSLVCRRLRNSARCRAGRLSILLFRCCLTNAITDDTGECVAVFGKRWGKELRLPTRGTSGSYFVDWVLAHVSAQGKLLSFVAVEVQSIDTTNNYRKERETYLREEAFVGKSTAGFNWENVNKRILPQIIYKGHVLRQEPLCQKGLFFVCPTPVYKKLSERLGGASAPVSNSDRELADDHVVRHRRIQSLPGNQRASCEREDNSLRRLTR